MRANATLLLLGTATLLSACRGGATSEFPSHNPGLRWTNRAHGEKHSIQHQRVAIPFVLDEAGTNGTAALLGYLKTLEQNGARFVSDVSIALQVRHNGTPIECVSQIRVEDGSAPRAIKAPEPERAAGSGEEPEYETTIRPWQPGLNHAWVEDRELACKKEGVLVAGVAPEYADRTAAETAKLWAKPGGDDSGQGTGHNRGAGALASREVPVAEIVYEDNCKLHKIRRKVLRYDHYVAARFVPADLARIGREYSDWKLTEAPPLCHPISVPQGAKLQQRIEGEVYFTGSFGKNRLPKAFTLL